MNKQMQRFMLIFLAWAYCHAANATVFRVVPDPVRQTDPRGELTKAREVSDGVDVPMRRRHSTGPRGFSLGPVVHCEPILFDYFRTISFFIPSSLPLYRFDIIAIIAGDLSPPLL